jgi:hypothetical protein
MNTLTPDHYRLLATAVRMASNGCPESLKIRTGFRFTEQGVNDLCVALHRAAFGLDPNYPKLSLSPPVGVGTDPAK